MVTKSQIEDRNLFLWRGNIRWGYDRDYDLNHSNAYGPNHIPAFYDHRFELCPFCQTQYKRTSSQYQKCSICGFSCSHEAGDHYGEGSNVDYSCSKISTIRDFPVSSKEITLVELATHLKRKEEDYYYLHPRRFEELIADVYKNCGYEVELTQETCDGGADILLLNNRKEQELVECKRCAKSRKISISIVRNILGVMVYKGIHKASIVSTSQFSKPAVDFSAGVQDKYSKFTINLVNASELVNSIGIYEADLPPLHLNPMLDRIQRIQEDIK